MKRFISLILALTFISSSALAAADTRPSLRESIDDLNYSLEVEWDQQDQLFFNHQMAIFKNRLEQLNLVGVKKSELLAEVLAATPESNQKSEMEKTLSLIDVDKLSDAELQNKILSLTKNGSHGASWDGGLVSDLRTLQIFGAVALVVVLVASQVNKAAATH